MSPSLLFKLNGSSLCSLVGLNTCNWLVIRFLLWLKTKVKWRKDVKIMSVWFRIKETSLKYRIFMSSCKMRNELETKRNKSKRNLPHFVSVNFVLLRFISFRFRFAFYRYPHRWDIQRRKTNNYQLGKSVTWQALGWHNLSLGDNLSYHTLTRLKIVYCIMLPGVNKFWTTSLAQG